MRVPLLLAAVLSVAHASPARGQEWQVEAEHIEEALARLGYDDYEVRERAQAELREIGLPAVWRLVEETRDPRCDPEVLGRIEQVVDGLAAGLSPLALDRWAFSRLRTSEGNVDRHALLFPPSIAAGLLGAFGVHLLVSPLAQARLPSPDWASLRVAVRPRRERDGCGSPSPVPAGLGALEILPWLEPEMQRVGMVVCVEDGDLRVETVAEFVGRPEFLRVLAAGLERSGPGEEREWILTLAVFARRDFGLAPGQGERERSEALRRFEAWDEGRLR